MPAGCISAAYPSMFQYCVGELGYAESAARKRVHAARAARRFPAIFDTIADGRLHLSAVVLLAPHLTAETADELLAAAEHKSKFDLERLVAERLPRLEMSVGAFAEDRTPLELEPSVERAPGRVSLSATKPAGASAATPADPPQRFPLRLSMDASTHAKLQYARELLSHQIPSGDMARVLDIALDALIDRLEKRKFAATSKPRAKSAGAGEGRMIPATVKREVWKRDAGQCTFVSESGHRCSSRKFLEFDHVLEFALGGRATPDGIRLRCRAHNQYTAERTFGTALMVTKREEARRAAEARALEGAVRREATKASAPSGDHDVVPWLRKLGFNGSDSRRAAEYCDTLPIMSLEDRVRSALRLLRPPCRGPGRSLPVGG